MTTSQKCDVDVTVGYERVGDPRDIYVVEGTCISDVWAVHNSLEGSSETEVVMGNKWTVTHVPTGHSLLSELPSKKSAVAVAELLIDQGVEPDSTNVSTASIAIRESGILALVADIRRAVQTTATGAEVVAIVNAWSGPSAGRRRRAPSRARPPSPSAPTEDSRWDEFFRLARALQEDNPSVLTPLTEEQAAAKDHCLC